MLLILKMKMNPNSVAKCCKHAKFVYYECVAIAHANNAALII